jgi:hypothetical protein
MLAVADENQGASARRFIDLITMDLSSKSLTGTPYAMSQRMPNK